MTAIDKAYLKQHAVFFEPASAEEAEALQRALIAMGYHWGFRRGQVSVAYVGRCLQSGLTALPEKRLFVGEPSDRPVARRACADLLGAGGYDVHEIARQVTAAAFAPARARADFEQAADHMPEGLGSKVDRLRADMRQRFDAIEYRQLQLEKTQTEILTQLRELRVMLTPRLAPGAGVHVVKKPERKS